MSFLASLTEAQTLQALRAFLVYVLPAGTEVVRGQPNRVPQVKGPDFVVMTPVARERISTNVDSYEDLAFTASVAGTAMTVTAILTGAIAVDDVLFGPNVTPSTKVISQSSGAPGGIGVYIVSPSQTAASATVAGGTIDFRNGVKVRVQLDIHGPNSAQNAHVASTLLRDAFAVDFFADPALGGGFDVTPLYADDARQTPFFDENQQAEERWSVDAVLQANPVVTTQQQFAAALVIGLIDVDAVYPPTGD